MVVAGVWARIETSAWTGISPQRLAAMKLYVKETNYEREKARAGQGFLQFVSSVIILSFGRCDRWLLW